MKRFYKAAAVSAAGDDFAITLDGKPVLTPAKAPLLVPNRALGEAVAAEWNSQGEQIDLASLGLTRIASTAIDLVVPRRQAVIEETVKYAGTDLVCYRASHPPALAERQRQVWQPLIDWARERYDAPLLVTAGVLPIAQPEATIAALASAVSNYEPMALTALRLATGACGSMVVALALLEGRLDAEGAFAAAELDESFEIEAWGEDEEQTKRRASLREEIGLADRFAKLLKE